MRNEEQIGYQIKELSRLLDKNIWQKSILNAGADTVTATHGWMIGYLYHHYLPVGIGRFFKRIWRLIFIWQSPL